MKLLTLLLLFTGSVTICFGQYRAPFAIIKDKDGFTNVRQSEKAGSRIIDSLRQNQVFEDLNLAPANESAKSDWHMITYGKYANKRDSTFTRTEEETDGYIHKTRILYLKDLPQLNKIIKDSLITLINDSIKVVIRTGKFISQKHVITYTGNSVTKIDNHRPWGIDGVLEKNLTEIKAITVYYRGKELLFPKHAIINLLNPNPENMHVSLSDNMMFLTMSNSDGAGAYNVVWTIENGTLVKQFLNIDF